MHTSPSSLPQHEFVLYYLFLPHLPPYSKIPRLFDRPIPLYLSALGALSTQLESDAALTKLFESGKLSESPLVVFFCTYT